MTPRSYQLNCVIEGETIVFPVAVGCDCVVGNLKKEIKKERALDTLKDVGPHTLELWKPKDSNPILAKPAKTLPKRVGDDLSKIADELDPTDSLFNIFSVEPLGEHVHIIVKAPTTGRLSKRPRLDNSPPHTPTPKIQAGTVGTKLTPPPLTRQEAETDMAAALAGFEKYIECLATGELDGYLDSIRPEDKLAKFGVHLPHKPLLIHNLGKHPDQERIKVLFRPNSEYGICDIIHLFSASSSGKTRLSLEGLCSHWGLYISCRTLTDTASGSDDFMTSMKMLRSMRNWCPDSYDLSDNELVASRTFAMLLCARIFILKQLVQHFPVDTDVTDARRRWVLAQVLPPRLSKQNEDLFVKVLRVLRHAGYDTMMDIIWDSLNDIMTNKTDLFPEGMRTPLFVVIDEAQVAAEYLKFFRSTTGPDRRPILREMVRFFHSSKLFDRIILSGTGLSMEMVQRAVGSLSAKRVPNEYQGVFTDVGRFTREGSSQEAYIRRYLTLSDNDISDKRLLERMKHWFSGRYRLTASLIEIFLHSENVPRHRVLTLFAEHLTGFKITDGTDLEAGEPPISPDLNKKIISYRPLTELDRLFKEEGVLSNRMQLINCLTDAIWRWRLGSGISIEDKMQEMIALGVGFLDKMPGIRTLEDDMNLPVYISEPLVVLSLRLLLRRTKSS